MIIMIDTDERKMTGRVAKKLERGETPHNLTMLRVKAGISQAALAEAVGRAQPFVGKIESGMTDINNITLESAYKLSKILGCNMEDLVDKKNVQWKVQK